MKNMLEQLIPFLECVIHTLLYTREIYPKHLFEQRRYLGILVWQCRHPEVNNYITKVLDNAKELFDKDLVDRMIFVTEYEETNEPIDHLTIKCSFDPKKLSTSSTSASSSSSSSTTQLFKTIEEEFRSIVLKLGMSNHAYATLPSNSTWKLMLVTKIPNQRSEEDVIQEALTNGQWYIENNQLTENMALSKRIAQKYAPTNKPTNVPRLYPIKSYRNEVINLSVYCHLFQAENNKEIIQLDNESDGLMS